MFCMLLANGILAYYSINYLLISGEPGMHERVLAKFSLVNFLYSHCFLAAKGKEKNNEPKKTAAKESADEKEEK